MLLVNSGSHIFQFRSRSTAIISILMDMLCLLWLKLVRENVKITLPNNYQLHSIGPYKLRFFVRIAPNSFLSFFILISSFVEPSLSSYSHSLFNKSCIRHIYALPLLVFLLYREPEKNNKYAIHNSRAHKLPLIIYLNITSRHFCQQWNMST